MRAGKDRGRPSKGGADTVGRDGVFVEGARGQVPPTPARGGPFPPADQQHTVPLLCTPPGLDILAPFVAVNAAPSADPTS